MKKLIFLFAFIGSHFAMCQTFTDIAAVQTIDFTQTGALNFANGMSFYDFNEDGWDDLTFPTDVDSIFFFRNDFGNYTKVTPSLYAPGEIRQMSWLDYDNDGDLDLFCSFHDIGIRLYENDGNFQFSDVTAAAGFLLAPFEAYGFSAADPDADGDLDIYVCVYWLPNTLNPIPNLYYENQGNGTFIEKAAMLNINNGISSTFQSVWFDMNNDNKLDLHVVNDRNSFQDELYLQTGPNTYIPSATAMGIANDGHFPMCLSVSDYNNDGFQDVFKTDAGNGNVFNGVVQDYKLYTNNNGGSFTEVAQSMNINNPAFAWGGLWVDYNNDCYEDLYVPTAFIDTFTNAPLTSVFYQNNQGTSFTNATDSIQANIIKSSFTAVKGDMNRDGFYDIAVLNGGSIPNILLNGGNSNQHVRITVVGTESNRMAIGSTIKVYANNTCQTQMLFCGSGLCAQNSQHKIFGIGNATIVDSVVVTFPNGNVAKRFNLPADSEHVILEKTLVQIPITTGTLTTQFCAGESVQIGVPGLQNYQWSTGQTGALISADTTGIYSFTAENAFGDSLFESYAVLLTFHADIPHLTTVIDAPCGAGSFGSAEVIPIIPSNIDSIVWSNGTNNASISNVVPNTYEYYLYSIFGCIDSGAVIIDEQPPFTSQHFTTACTDLVGGTVQFYTWGGIPPFVYTLNSTVVSDYVENLLPGIYEMIIADSLGCIDTISFEIQNATTTSVSEKNAENVLISYSDASVSICGLPNTGNYDVQVINSLGQRITNWKDNNDSECQLSPLQLDKGWYVIVVRSQSDLHTYNLSVD